MFNYYLYRRIFLSDIKLFNIPSTNEMFSSPDVIILNETIKNDSLPQKNGIYIKKEFAVIKLSFGYISIKSGKEILYYLENGYVHESITPYIIGWGMAFVLTQMGHSAFHCSALVRNNQCFFVSGISGSGKSTTSLELIKRGCKYLCDDIAIVDSYDNMLIPPSFPIQKVCPDVSCSLDPNSLYFINNERGKYSYLNTHEFCNVPVKLTMFFQLVPSDEDSVRIEELTGIQKYLQVLENLFLELQYALSSFPEEEKFRCLKIASKIKFFTIF